MKKPLSLGYLVVTLLLVLGWMGLSGTTSQAVQTVPLLDITDTPTPTPETPTHTPTATPEGPTNTPRPPSTDTPPPPPPETPSELTPVGTPLLPQTGLGDATPFLILLVAAVGLLALGIWLPRRIRRSL
jgi:LPXTG-motif cell wall-anchored protein